MGDITKCSEELVGRLIDECRDKSFLALAPSETEIFENPQRGWDLSVKRFPEIIEDVEEASKCFALSRYGASVFHSVQIIEFCLIELGTFLKVEDPHSGWSAVSSALKKVIDKKHQDRTQFERKNFPFLEQMQGLVQGLKNAWRNKISHSHGRLVLMSGEFKPETAEEILMATRAFTRRLAEELHHRNLGRARRSDFPERLLKLLQVFRCPYFLAHGDETLVAFGIGKLEGPLTGANG